MKGFTKGKGKGKKFIPTSRNKSGLKKSDVSDDPLERARQNMSRLPDADPVKLKKEMIRKKQSLDKSKSTKEIKIESIRFNMADNFGIRYEVDGEGELTYVGGLKTALEKAGARKLSTKEIGTLIDKDNETDVSSRDFFDNPEEASNDYRVENTNDNTINFGSLYSEMTDFGFFKVNGRDFLAVTSHVRDEDDGIYDIAFVEDVEGIGEEAEKWHVGGILDPRLDIEFTVSGKKFRIEKNNGASGFDSLQDEDDSGFSESDVLGEYNGNLEKAIDKFTGGVQ